MKNITLADIAAATGFSINTVSHALNDKPDISKKTKEYIRKVADDMGYIANVAAGALRSGKSKSVAIIVGDISNPHFSSMIKEMEAALRTYNYSAIIMNTNEDEALEKSAIISAISKSVDGILLCPTQKSTKNITFLNETGVPFILFGRYFQDVGTHYVVCDDNHGGFITADYLFKNGHRDILFINTFRYISSANDRLQGIQTAFKEHGIPTKHLHYAEVPAANNTEHIPYILEQHKDCSAIICFSDLIAMQVCHILKQEGRQVPQDVAIIGFDNIASKFFLPLMVTSVSSSKTKMSLETVHAIMNIIDTKPSTFFQKMLPTKLIEREST